MNRTVKPFSSGYYIVDADVVEHAGDGAIVAHDYFGELVNYVTHPLLRHGGDHYWARPERGVPGNTIAIPVDLPGDETVLMAKDETAHRLVSTGEKASP